MLDGPSPAEASPEIPRAIVADPDPEERTRIRALVQRAADEIAAPLQVIEVGDGNEAAAAFEPGKVALVVCEVLLPGRSGLSLLRQLVDEHGRDGAPPVVVVTRLSRESDRYWGLRCGAHGYVTKPYEDDQLFERIRHALLGGTAERPRV